MRPLTSFEIQPALLEQKPVLFLNEAMLPIRYLIRQVLADKLPSNLPRLPPEIWCIVIDQHADVCTPEYLPVLPISISGLPHKGERLLHCRLTSFTLPFGDQGAVLASERFMQSTSHFSDTPLRDCERWAFKADEFYAEDTDIVADILFPVDASASAPSTCRSRPLLPTKAGLGSPPPEAGCHVSAENSGVPAPQSTQIAPSTVGESNTLSTATATSIHTSTALASAPALRVPDCLYTAITVRDVICFIDGGCCWLCEGHGYVCPSCDDGLAREYHVWLCGMVLACPLCMGLDIMAEEQVFLEKYHGRPPIEAYDAREARINARRAELGYDEQDEQDEQPEQDQYDEVHYRLTRSRVAQQIQMSI